MVFPNERMGTGIYRPEYDWISHAVPGTPMPTTETRDDEIGPHRRWSRWPSFSQPHEGYWG
jgi:hypothetical protein